MPLDDDEYTQYGLKNPKQSFDDYEAPAHSVGGVMSDIQTFTDPLTFLPSLFGVKNPLQGIVHNQYGNVLNNGADISSRVKFSGWNGYQNLGGPIGAAVAGITGSNRIPEDQQRAVYASMSPEELQKVGQMSEHDQQNWVMQRVNDLKSGKATGAWEDPQLKAAKQKQSAADAAKAQQDSWMQKLQAFADEMRKPLDPNDPMVKAIVDPAKQNAQFSTMDRGLGGDWANRMADQSGILARAQLQNSRDQMGLNALSQGAGYTVQQQQLAEKGREFDVGTANDLATQQYQQQMGKNQANGAMMGGLGGAALGYFTGGGWSGAATGMKTGSQLGGGLGGANTPLPTYRYPSYGGGGRNSGGLSGGY